MPLYNKMEPKPKKVDIRKVAARNIFNYVIDNLTAEDTNYTHEIKKDPRTGRIYTYIPNVVTPVSSLPAISSDTLNYVYILTSDSGDFVKGDIVIQNADGYELLAHSSDYVDSLQTQINTLMGDIQNGYVVNITKSNDNKKITITQVINGVEQTPFEFQGGSDVDSALSSTSENPVQNKVIKQVIDDINALIPSSANANNQLADKDFVNSSISTNTANFIGTFSKVELLQCGVLANDSVIGGGSITKKGSIVNNGVAPIDITLIDYVTVNSTTKLAFGSILETGSIIEVGSIINHIKYNATTILANALTIDTITNNDYAFITNSEYDFATTTLMNDYDKTLLTNFDYAWIPNDTKYDLYRFDIVNQTWNLRASAVEKADITLNSAYNRYKYNGSDGTWQFEYTLNNSSFTANQWLAINSGINDDKVASYDAHIADTTIHVTQQEKTTWNAKQDAITSSNKLSSSLVNDGTQNNKFVSDEMYDYLEGVLYQVPRISLLQLYYNDSPVTTVENGTIVTVNQIRHQETNIANIRSLTFNGQAITPSESATIVNLTTPITASITTVYTMSGVNTRNASFTRTATITVQTYAYSSLTSSTTAPTSSLTRQNIDTIFRSEGADFNYSVGDYLYLYTTSSSATKIQTSVLGQWADVTTTSVGQVTITKSNGTTQTYYCFRTTSSFSASGTAKYRVV